MARADADNPNLSLWVMGFKAIAGSNLTRVNLKGSGFEVNRYNFSMIACFDLRAHLSFIKLVTTSSKFFFAVAGLPNSHQLDLVSTLSL
jgi:hypothetical protein